jgi:phage shock protein PspC (stress-responsive transcriptional regulator)
MQKVITINLNGNAYPLEEPGYEALRAYLDRAQEQLRGNPDRAEILSDIEQAIAEKCARCLIAGKTVVTGPEIETILAEMGPVESAEAHAGAAEETQAGSQPRDKGAPKRLYQIREGAMISGVCNGLAAYFNIDVTLVRIGFVLFAVVTAGAALLVYAAMMVIIPYADTSEDRAAAFGLPFNVQELIAQAKLNHAHFRARHAARKKRREARMRACWRPAARFADMGPAAAAEPHTMGYAERAVWGVWVPVFAMARAALFVVWIFAMISLLSTHTVFGFTLPQGVPLWVWMVALLAIYGATSAPLRAMHHGWISGHSHVPGPWIALHGLVWLAFVILFFWLAYTQIPEARALIDGLPRGHELWDQVTRGGVERA